MLDVGGFNLDRAMELDPHFLEKRTTSMITPIATTSTAIANMTTITRIAITSMASASTRSITTIITMTKRSPAWRWSMWAIVMEKN